MPVVFEEGEKVTLQDRATVRSTYESGYGHHFQKPTRGKLTLTNKRLIFEWKTGGLLSKEDDDAVWWLGITTLHKLDMKGMLAKKVYVELRGPMTADDLVIEVPTPDAWAERMKLAFAGTAETT